MEGIQWYDQWKIQTPEDSTPGQDPEWGTCRKCRKDGHLYSLSPVGYGEFCNRCLNEMLKERAK